MAAVNLAQTFPEGHPKALSLRNPVLWASGTFGIDGYGAGLPPSARFQDLGAVVVKTTTLRPRPGNPTPRMVTGWGWLLNSMGLPNPGIDVVLKEKAPEWARWRVPVVLSIAGERVGEFGELAGMAEGVAGIAALEVNVSCPNVEGGLEFAQEAGLAAEVTRRVKAATSLPVFVKLSPNVTDITVVAKAVADAGADALTLVNTLVGMAIDVKSGKPALGAGRGGVSGPALKPVALNAVYRVLQEVEVPIIGVGGVTTGHDALEFLVAGARAVAVGTASFPDPEAPWQVLMGLRRLLGKRGVGEGGALRRAPSVAERERREVGR